MIVLHIKCHASIRTHLAFTKDLFWLHTHSTCLCSKSIHSLYNDWNIKQVNGSKEAFGYCVPCLICVHSFLVLFNAASIVAKQKTSNGIRNFVWSCQIRNARCKIMYYVGSLSNKPVGKFLHIFIGQYDVPFIVGTWFLCSDQVNTKQTAITFIPQFISGIYNASKWSSIMVSRH